MTHQTPTTETPTTDTPAKPVITFEHIAKSPSGLTTLIDTAKLFNRHAETLRRWVRDENNPFIKPVAINGFYYFKNSDILAYIDNQQMA